MDSNEILKVLTEELVERVLNKMKSREESGDETNGKVDKADGTVVIGRKSLEDTLNDWEDILDDLDDEDDTISRRNNCRRSKRKLICSKRLERAHITNKHDELENVKDNIKEDRTNLFKLLHDDLYKDVEELRKLCTDTNMYSKRFDQDDYWFTDSVDGTMDSLERSGREYMELIDSLIAYIDDLITKIDNGEIK